MKKQEAQGQWETHPCTFPVPTHSSSEGCVWRCHCGRRWKVTELGWDYDLECWIGTWEEQAPVMDDASFVKLENLANTPRARRWRHRL